MEIFDEHCLCNVPYCFPTIASLRTLHFCNDDDDNNNNNNNNALVCEMTMVVYGTVCQSTSLLHLRRVSYGRTASATLSQFPSPATDCTVSAQWYYVICGHSGGSCYITWARKWNRPCVVLHESHSRYAASWTVWTWLEDVLERLHYVSAYPPAALVSRQHRPSQTSRVSSAKISPLTRRSDKLCQQCLQVHSTSHMPACIHTQTIILRHYRVCYQDQEKFEMLTVTTRLSKTVLR